VNPDFNRLLEKTVNFYWELRLGVRTRAFQEDAAWITAEHVHYAATSYPVIFRILDFLDLSSIDIVVDLGCGKGRVVCCAARYHLAEVIGVEDVPVLSEYAETNSRIMRGRNSKISIVKCKAEDFDYSRGTVFFLNNPFGPQTLDAVLTQMKRAAQLSGKRLVYFNPVHERLLERDGSMERYAHWPAARDLYIAHPVSFWRSRTVTVARALES
jgi:predicted RNA methylase